MQALEVSPKRADEGASPNNRSNLNSSSNIQDNAQEECCQDYCREDEAHCDTVEGGEVPSEQSSVPCHQPDRGSFAEAVDDGSIPKKSDTEVVYMREGVSVRPTATTRIDGRLSLVRQGKVLFITWLPYVASQIRPGSSTATQAIREEAGSQKLNTSESNTLAFQTKPHTIDRSMYAVHPIPLSDIRAVRPHTSPFSQHTVTMIFQSGATMPTFFYRQGGVRSFISALKQHASLIPSADSPGTYLINDLADPLHRSLTTLELSDTVLAPPPHRPALLSTASGGAVSWPLAPLQIEEAMVDRDMTDIDGSSSFRAHILDLVDAFQKMTQGARGAASSLLAGSVMGGGRGGGAPEMDEENRDASSVVAAGISPPTTMEGSQRAPEPSPLVASTSFGVRSGDLCSDMNGLSAAGSARGGERLSVSGSSGSPPSSVTSGWELIDRSMSTEFEALPKWARPRPPPLTHAELQSMMDSNGLLTDEAGLRARAFYGGIDPGARPQAWRWFLGVDAINSTATTREEVTAARRAQYVAVRRQWQSMRPEQVAKFGKWKERKSRVDKDVRRTDRKHPFFMAESSPACRMLRNVLLTHVMWNFDLGYCQGMSDVASPLLWVASTTMLSSFNGDCMQWQPTPEERTSIEAETFWMFASLMDDGMAGNFSSDCVGMHTQLAALARLLLILDAPLHDHLKRHDALNLFFCYRWVLILFKREFSFDKVLRLWEALWAHPGDNFLLYVCVAVLERQRRRILDEDLDFDGLLKLCVDLAGHIDLEQTLADAEMLREFAGEAGHVAVIGDGKEV